MPREKHGRYDAGKHLPDNTMQPQESGLYVWLQQRVIETLGNEQAQALIEESRTHGVNRYKWLITQMDARGHDDLIAAYHNRMLADAAQARIRDKQRQLANCQRQLEIETNLERQVYLRKQVQKLQKYIDERSNSKMDKTLLGTGMLSWPNAERIVSRYGRVGLFRAGNPEVGESGAQPVKWLVDVKPFVGRHGMLVAEMEGETYDLGSGTFFIERDYGCDYVGLKPDDGREVDWLNVDNLYKVDWQLSGYKDVNLYFVPTSNEEM